MSSLYAQEENNAKTNNHYSKNSVGVELFGASLFWSVNYHRIFKLNKKLNLKTGLGISVRKDGTSIYSNSNSLIYENNAFYIFSFPLRLDMQFGNNKVNPVFGLTVNPFINSSKRELYYTVYSFNTGVNIKIFDYFQLIPKYYALYSNNKNWYSDEGLIHWFGIQFNIHFPINKLNEE